MILLSSHLSGIFPTKVNQIVDFLAEAGGRLHFHENNGLMRLVWRSRVGTSTRQV
jgi:hypothetical protein